MLADPLGKYNTLAPLSTKLRFCFLVVSKIIYGMTTFKASKFFLERNMISFFDFKSASSFLLNLVFRWLQQDCSYIFQLGYWYDKHKNACLWKSLVVIVPYSLRLMPIKQNIKQDNSPISLTTFMENVNISTLFCIFLK